MLVLILKSFLIGVSLGTIFFGGFWFTKKIVARSKLKSFWMICSLIMRVVITVTGFYLFSACNLQKLIINFFGFIAAYFLILWLTGFIGHKKHIS